MLTIGRTRLGAGRWTLALFSLGVLAACSGQTPLAAVENYTRAVYARDYASAYAYLSADDQAALSKKDYLAQYDTYTGAQLEIARQLARWIEIQQPQVTETGDAASVSAHVRAPDGNAPAVADILDQAGKSGADVAALKKKLDDLRHSGQLPFLEADQTFELQRASGRWGVSLKLGQATLVNFTTGVQAGLPWEFTPLQPSARLLVGDLVRVQFHVKNLSDQTVTGKAEEGTSPEELANHLNFYQCFCMLQLTLVPGQEETLTAVIQLQQPVPVGTALSVHYDFYPLEAFPTAAAP